MNDLSPLSSIEKLTAKHQVKRFRCGQHALDYFLSRYALENQKKEASTTYVVHRNHVVVGYFTLAFGSIAPLEVPSQISTGMPPFPIPVMVLAHWAVDRTEQGRGLGSALLKDAFLRTLQAADIAGLRAILLDAINERVAKYYSSRGFQPCPVGERGMIVPIEDVRASLTA